MAQWELPSQVERSDDKIKPMEINPRLYDAEPMQRCCLTDCRAACCLYGVWIDLKEVQIILDHALLIGPHMRAGFANPISWFDSSKEEDDEFTPSKRVRHSIVLDDMTHYGKTACVFLREDSKCALQVAADANQLPSWQFKPFYCVLHPLDLDEEGRITLDETQLLLEEPGSCLRSAARLIPLAETFSPELTFFLGEEKQKRILKDARTRLKAK